VIEEGQSAKSVAIDLAVSERTVRRYVKRSKEEGPAGLQDRSSRPHRLYRPTPEPIIQRIAELRRERMTGKAIAAEIGVCAATVSRVLKRLGLNKLKMLEPAEPVHRYEREYPGELIHIDIKSSASSTRSATASRATAQVRATAAAWVGSSSMCASTTPSGLPSAW
jgi:transposase